MRTLSAGILWLVYLGSASAKSDVLLMHGKASSKTLEVDVSNVMSTLDVRALVSEVVDSSLSSTLTKRVDKKLKNPVVVPTSRSTTQQPIKQQDKLARSSKKTTATGEAALKVQQQVKGMAPTSFGKQTAIAKGRNLGSTEHTTADRPGFNVHSKAPAQKDLASQRLPGVGNGLIGKFDGSNKWNLKIDPLGVGKKQAKAPSIGKGLPSNSLGIEKMKNSRSAAIPLKQTAGREFSKSKGTTGNRRPTISQATKARGKGIGRKLCRRGDNDSDPECRPEIEPDVGPSARSYQTTAPSPEVIPPQDKPRKTSPKAFLRGISLGTQEKLERGKAETAARNAKWQSGIHGANIAATGTGLSSGFPALCCHGMACGSKIACSAVAGASLVGSGILIAACAGVATCIKFQMDRQREREAEARLDEIYGDNSKIKRKQSEHEKTLQRQDGMGNDLRKDQQNLAKDVTETKNVASLAEDRGIRNTLELMSVKDSVNQVKDTSMKASTSTNSLRQLEETRWTTQKEANRASELRHRRIEQALNLPEWDPSAFSVP